MNLLHALIATLGPRVVAAMLMAIGVAGGLWLWWIRARRRRRAFEAGRVTVRDNAISRERDDAAGVIAAKQATEDEAKADAAESGERFEESKAAHAEADAARPKDPNAAALVDAWRDGKGGVR